MSFWDSIGKLDKHAHGCACEGDTACHGHGQRDAAATELPADRLLLVRILVSAMIFAAALLLNISETLELVLLIAAAVICGLDVYIGAVVHVVQKRVIDECLLISVVSIAAFIIGEGHEGAAVMLLYQIGEVLQNFAVNRTRRSVSELVDLRLDSATLLDGGELRRVRADELNLGDIILIGTGERVPTDCVVAEGESGIDLSALTGESKPLRVAEGDAVMSGAVNIGAPFRAEVTAPYAQSTASRMAEAMEAEAEGGGKTEKFITKFAKIYTPAVVALAVLVAVLEPFLFDVTFSESVHRALVFIVVACPCALVISVPLTYFAGIGGASKLGILFKNAMAVDAMAKARAVVFDKTGVLTTGRFRVTAVKSDRMKADMFLKIAAHAVAYSNTPLSRAIISAYGGTIYIELIQNFTEAPGKGISVTVDKIPIVIGSEAYLRELGVELGADANAERALYMAVSGIYAGRLCLEDPVREGAAEAVRGLGELTGSAISMVTSDNDRAAADVAKAVGITNYYTGCRPADKVERIRELKGKVGPGGTLIFVGGKDEDEAALREADAGVALGGLSGALALKAADMVVMDEAPGKLAAAIRTARGARNIVFQNIAFIFTIKLTVLVLGFFGISQVWFAVFADVGVAIAASLNAIRAYYVNNGKKSS